MTCEETRERMVLMLYGDLEAAALGDVEAHVRGCGGCGVALAEERRLRLILAQAPAPLDPDEDLLRRCRADLARALEAGAPTPRGAEPRRAWPRLRWSPAAAAILLAVGFLAGRLASGPERPAGTIEPDADGAPERVVSSVSALEADPLSDEIALSYETLRRGSLRGTASDPAIRGLLVDTVRGSVNDGMRLEALDALRRHAAERDVRAALLHAVREDANAGARLKAIDALQASAAGDAEVRGAILEALLRDDNPGVRVRALDVLEEARAPETRPALQRLAREDRNDYVRQRSAAVVHAIDSSSGGGR